MLPPSNGIAASAECFTTHSVAMLQYLPIFGFGFNSIWMLAWVAGAAVPILLHLLNQRSQGTVRWAAMRLLQQVIEKESKRIRFEQLILLLIRALIFGVLAFALARPFMGTAPTSEQAPGSRPPRLWIVVIDCSYSMEYLSRGQSRFDEAKAAAIELVSQAAENDAFTLIALSAPSRSIIREPTFNRSRMKTAIEGLTTNDLGADLSSAFGQIEVIANSSSQITEMPQQSVAVIYSDMGTDTWNSQVRLEELVDSLPDSVAIEAISLATERPSNVFVSDLQAAPTDRTQNQSFRASADVRQVNGVTASNLDISLSVDGMKAQSKQVTVPANGTARVSFDFEVDSPGPHTLTVQLPEDRLSNDNQRHLVLTARRTTSVLFVEDSPGDSRVFQLAAGISSTNDAGARESSLAAESTTPLQMVSRDLNRFNLVVCCDLSYVSEDILKRLQSYVSQGGSLLVCFGENTREAQWNLKTELLGFRLMEPSDFGDWKIDPLEYASPITKPFQGFPESGLLTTPIFRFWKTEQIDPLLRTELGIRNAGPFITLFPLDQGNVASLLSAPSQGASANQATNVDPLTPPADGETWNALTTWPSFVPLVQELLRALLDAKQERLNLTCGQFLRGFSNKITPLEVMIADPENNVTSVRSESTPSGAQQWLYSRTQNRGLYRVTYQSDGSADPNPSHSGVFALNLDSQQSMLIAAPLPKFARNNTTFEEAASPTTNQTDDPFSLLSRFSLGALLLLLCIESLLAWHFGRRLR